MKKTVQEYTRNILFDQVKAKDAPEETAKFLGHGFCDNVTKSSTLATSTADSAVITREVLSISHQLNINPKDMRGIGIHLSRLESARKIGGIDTFLKANKKSLPVRDSIENSDSSPTTVQSVDKQNGSQSNSQSKVETGKTNSVLNFFAVKKSSQSGTNKTKTHSELLCPENFDKDVVAALPKDIQEELAKEFGLKEVQEANGNKTLQRESNKETVVGSDKKNGTDIRERSKTHQELLYPENFDKEVIAALPEDIKKEVMDQYGLSEIPESVAGPSRLHEGDHESMSMSQIDMNVLAELPEDVREEIEENLSKKEKPQNQEVSFVLSKEKRENRLCENLTLKEIRCLIQEWVSTELEPQKCDIEMLMEYMQHLVERRQLEDLHIAMKCLYRCIEKSGQQVWQEAYFSIVNGVQEIMRAVYNANLIVQEAF